MNRLRMVASAALVAAASCLGCADSVEEGASIRGKVTLNGVPVSRGMVVFEVGGHGQPKTAVLRPDGSYELYGLPEGKARVAVRTSPFQGAMTAQARYAQKARTRAEKVELVMVPRRYENAATSRLEFLVEDGKEINIPLLK